MAETSDPRLSSPTSMVALLAGAAGATFEIVAFVLFLVNRESYRADTTSLVAADALIALLSLIGAGITIKDPRVGALALALAGLGSFFSDLVGLSTPPRMIPGGLMVLSAVITFATYKEPEKPVEVPEGRPHWLPILANIGVGLHIFGGGFIGLGAGLVAPPIGVMVGWAIWAVILFFALRVRRRKPWLAVISPFVGIGAWVGLIALGSAIFGWTA